MNTTIGQRELRNDNAVLIRRVEAGESFTVTRRGVPVADLTPHRQSGENAPPPFLPIADLIFALDELPPWNSATFDREQDELDALVDDDPRDPW